MDSGQNLRPGSNVAVPSGMSSLAAAEANQRSLKVQAEKTNTSQISYYGRFKQSDAYDEPVSRITLKEMGGVPTATEPK